LLYAKLEADRGNYQVSEQLCRRYLKKLPDGFEAHYLLGLIYQSEEKPAQAAESLRYTIFIDRDFVMGHWHLALIYQQLQDKEAMRRHLMRAKSLLASLPANMEVKFSEGQTASRILQTVEMMLKG
jgi:tetratricopeptide (TPR) repeat protein